VSRGQSVTDDKRDSLPRGMSHQEDADGWVPSPGPWRPPPGVKPGENWTPSPYGPRPRTEAMPEWVRIWYRLPLLDRRARVYMWHHGYWAVPPTLDWKDHGRSHVVRPYRRSWMRTRILGFRRRSRFEFGIRWSWWIRIPAYVLAAVIGRLVGGWWGALGSVLLTELGLQAISLYSGQKLRRPDVSDVLPSDGR
jgi:hypothetical protein